MASSPLNSLSEPAVVEQVITEFFAKSLHIILESRSPFVSSRNYSVDLFTSSPSSSASASSSSGRPRDKWFNLALRDCPAALENFDLWRQSNLEPLVVDVMLIRRSSKELHLNCWAPGREEFVSEDKCEKIVERWIVQYENRKGNSSVRESQLGSKKSGSGGGASHSSDVPSLYKKTYRRTIVLLRSLYVTVRLLPAYKLFRDLNSSGRIRPFSLSHKISSFVEPFTRAEEAEMNQFGFVPVDTPCGRLSLSVSYIPVLEDISSEPSTPISTQFIPDYVGSPTTDCLKKLHSLPSAGSLPTYVSFTRRHSWSDDHGATPSMSSSPSPTHSDSHALHYNRSPHLPPRGTLPNHYPLTCPASRNVAVTHVKNASSDEYWPTPPFSPSSSPSPPTHLPVANLRNYLLRSESAPVSIPLSRIGGNNQALPPSPSSQNAKPGCPYQSDTLRAQVLTSSASQTSSPESKPKKESLRLGEFQTGMALQKILYSGKDEAGNSSGLKISSCTSPRIPSRSSSRFSFLDEFDDSEFTYPFAVDDEDLTDSYRIKPSDSDVHDNEDVRSGGLIPARRSPDAVVGAFVRLLKTAPPLRQDLCNSVRCSLSVSDETWNQGIQLDKVNEAEVKSLDNTASGLGISASGLFKSRTAADALVELKGYKHMKELLLRQSESQSLDVDQEPKSAPDGASEL